MKKSTFLSLLLLAACSKKPLEDKTMSTDIKENIVLLQEDDIELSPPVVKIDSIFFNHSAKITMSAGDSQSIIKYNTDGLTNIVYKGPFEISNSSEIETWIEKEGFKKSESKKYTVMKVPAIMADAEITTDPISSETYPGNGVESLNDLKKGAFNFKEGNAWLGFKAEEVTIEVNFSKSIEADGVVISFLSDPPSWIFEPQTISVYADGNLLSRHVLDETRHDDESSMKIMPIQWGIKIGLKKLSIKIEQISEIPDWHVGSGSKPWMFIDEIFIQ